MKKVIRKLSWFSLTLIILTFFIFQLSPLVISDSQVDAKKVAVARDNAKHIWKQFSSSQTLVSIKLGTDDVDSIAQVASFIFDNTEVSIGFNQYGVTLASTSKFKTVYLNVHCTLSLDNTFYKLDGCHIGDLYVPGIIVNSSINLLTWLIFDSEISETVQELLTHIEVTDQEIILTATKNTDFKSRVNSHIADIADIAISVSQNQNVDSDKVQFYLSKLEEYEPPSSSLANYVNFLMKFAINNSIEGNAVEENTAIIWALAIKFGSLRFARLAGFRTDTKRIATTLRGRQDLALHFLYSTMLQQLGREHIGFKIGEVKEILDSGKGGSGFSFADLAADKAGIMFADYLTRGNNSALRAQEVLYGKSTELTFFPFTHDLPEGFSERNFINVIGGVGSKEYLNLEAKISRRIALLELYNESYNNFDVTYQSEQSRLQPKVTNGEWLKIDTHIHSKYSDGQKTVHEIANKAAEFGCDFIAITDHGDKDFKKVLSDSYFTDIENVNSFHKHMTVIPGFEWNIPPFGGREHVTVLFPKTVSMQHDLRAFKEKFDHFREYKKQFLSAIPAFEWLNNLSESADVKPILIYNHPSRKNFQMQENQYDFESWSQKTDLVIGFSGAPGHQRKRKKNNGSYESKLYTINGWDPSVATIGGEWDRLLQKGYRVTAARAASDFHNLKMDYWPCEFSSTHLFSKSNYQNDVLTALKAGKMWAQHGNFIESLSFSIIHNGKEYEIGDTLRDSFANTPSKINLSVNLRDSDWRGGSTSLDKLEVILIAQNLITIVPVDVSSNMHDKTLKVEIPKILRANLTAIRVRGESIQPELHHYMFYTNPIYLNLKGSS
ncbi:PHP domain-containing protein [Paraglaciecola sp. 2405UD69-4]|uniref:PHP domain-containing protein n=1 Tax=Paraglaciecola sp. 2405UD69-4 TaxID=3391836 RepID=UPI0039C926EA